MGFTEPRGKYALRLGFIIHEQAWNEKRSPIKHLQRIKARGWVRTYRNYREGHWNVASKTRESFSMDSIMVWLACFTFLQDWKSSRQSRYLIPRGSVTDWVTWEVKEEPLSPWKDLGRLNRKENLRASIGVLQGDRQRAKSPQWRNLLTRVEVLPGLWARENIFLSLIKA